MAADRPVPEQIWQRSLARPPLELPTERVDRNVLADFLRERAQPWGRVPAPLSPAAVVALWTVLALNLVFGGYLLAVRAGTAACSGIVCTAATLGDHLLLTLILTGVCASALAVSVPMTRGLSRAGAPQLGLIVIGAVSGAVALVGVVVVLAVTVLCLAAAFGLFAAFVDRL